MNIAVCTVNLAFGVSMFLRKVNAKLTGMKERCINKPLKSINAVSVLARRWKIKRVCFLKY